jgi:hypothetical protein
MISRERISRLRAASLWSKNNFFDMIVTKWSDLWPEDVDAVIDLAEKLHQQPISAREYRMWLRSQA